MKSVLPILLTSIIMLSSWNVFAQRYAKNDFKLSSIHPFQKSDCDSLIVVDPFSINEIESPFQLTFLNEVAQNRLDSLVHQIINTHKPELISLLIDSIGQIQSQEAFGFLYTLCSGPWLVHDLNAMNGLHAKISAYGGFEALDLYFLDNRFGHIKNDGLYRQKILEHCSKEKPTVYFCKTLHKRALLIRDMRQVNTRKYDRQIIRIIKTSSDFEKMLSEIDQLSFVQEVFYDKCSEKLLILPGKNTLGVLMLIDGIQVEKCYEIQLGKAPNTLLLGRIPYKRQNYNEHKLIYKSSYINPGFIQSEKEKCNPPVSPKDLFTLPKIRTSQMVFADSVGSFFIDSLSHDLGYLNLKPGRSFEVKKYFRYMGDQPVSITGQINDDPNFLTEFNQTTLVKGRVYSCTVFLHRNSNQPNLYSKMVLKFSDGTQMPFVFKGIFKSDLD